MNRVSLLVPFALFFVACPEPPPSPDVSCGADTELVDGACVSTLKRTTCGEGTELDVGSGECRPITTCAEGTTLDPETQTCVGDTTCGPGTTLDPATGECKSDVACGAGTLYDAGQRLCVPEAECGTGTELEVATQRCVPLNVCGAGTIRNNTTNLCDPEVLCGTGLIVHEGSCITEDDLLVIGADAVEPGNDLNDPAFGGTPEQLTLEGPNQSVVFTGTIGRPVDLDADLDDDQDHDFWQFNAVGGTALRIRVLSTGLPEPAFRITGPEGYARQSRLGDLEPEREVVLPRSGDYVVEITTAADLRGNATLTGSPDHGYIGVIEEIPFPSSPPLALSQLPTFSTQSGTLFDLRDNAVQLGAVAGSGAQWRATVTGGNTTPLLLLFDGQRRFIEEVSFSVSQGAFTPLIRPAYLEEDSDFIVVFDWRDSDGADADFALTAATLPEVDIGPVAPDSIVEMPRFLIPGEFGATYKFSATQGQVIVSHFSGISTVTAILVGPSGIVETTSAVSSGHEMFARESGEYVWVLASRSTSDVRVSAAVLSFTPIDAGIVSATPQVFSGDDLAPGRRVPDKAYILAETSTPVIMRASMDFSFSIGDLKVSTISPTGALENRVQTSEDGALLVPVLRQEPSLNLIVLDPGNLDPPNPAVRDWTVTVSGDPIPVDTEIEPNDDNLTATPLPALPAELTGNIVDNEKDRFRLELPQALAQGEMIEVTVQNLTSSSATFLRILDDAGTQIYQESTTLVSRWVLLPGDGPGPFVIELEGTVAAGIDYVLQVRPVSGFSEVEPNDAATAPQVLDVSAGLPLKVFGTTKIGQLDFYSFTLAAPLPAGTGLRLRAQNEGEETDDIRLSFVTSTGTEIVKSEAEDAVLFVPAVDVGPFFIKIEGDRSTAFDVYSLEIDTIGPIEVEPNNSIADATPLPLVGAGPALIFGQDKRVPQIDFYAVTPDAALVDGEVFSIRWFNLLERGDIEVRVFASDGTEVLFSEDYSNEIVFAPIGDPGPFFVSVGPDGSSTNTRPEPYMLTVEKLNAITEAEPNNDLLTAQPVPPVTSIRAQSRIDDLDVYSLTAGASGTLLIEGHATLRQDDITVVVRDDAGTELASATELDVFLDVDVAPGATVTVEINSSQSDSNELRVYTLDLASN